jgi:hypothetical protein
MKGTSPTCRHLAEAHLGRLPDRYRYGDGHEPTYEAIQEIFWSCAVELVCRLLGGLAPPPEVRVGKEQVPVPVDAGDWQRLDDELGLADPRLRWEVAQILAAQMSPNGAAPPTGIAPLAGRYPPRLLGFVLLVCYLEGLSRRGPPRSYGYQFGEMTQVSSGPLNWLPVGAFDEDRVTREFFDYAAIRIRRSDRLLWIPYHGFAKPLRARLVQLTIASPGPAPAPIHEPEAPAREEVSSLAGASGSSAGALRDELNRLRAENDWLRDQAAGRILLRALQPLLGRPEDPADGVQRALDGEPALSRDLLYALLSALHAAGLEFYGRPDDVVELSLPHAEFVLDETVPPAPRDLSRGRFRVCRRGVRVNGRVLGPATVVPLDGGRR